MEQSTNYIKLTMPIYKVKVYMIKATLKNGGLLFGLSKENIHRLMNGEPIQFNLKKMGLEDRNVIIMYGETEEKMYEELIDHITLKTIIEEE